jgi:outer membrane lipoprotein-sorting protein
MNKKIVLLIAVLVVSLGFLIGCTESPVANNDDEEFLMVAEVIHDGLYPVTASNLNSRYAKVEIAKSDYKFELDKYTLSIECNVIRRDLEDAMQYIVWAYDESNSMLRSQSLIDGSIEGANTFLEQAKIVMDNLS